MSPLLCFLFLSIALVHGKTINIQADPNIMPKLVQASSDCIASTGLNDDILKQIMDWKLENNETTKKLLYCIGIKLNYIDKKGHILVDEAMNLAVSKKRSILSDALKQCNNQEGSDKYDTLYKIIICARDQGNLLISF